jgi:septum formation protein
MTRVVLASASPGRRKVLRQAGIDPLVVVSGVDEEAALAALGTNPVADHATTALAIAKAEAVVGMLDASVSADCVVIGCDSMLHCDGRLRGKPDSVSAARDGWHTMAGRSGQLHTGHCLIRMHHNAIAYQEAESSVTTVHFGSPSSQDLETYLLSGEPTAVAGGFTLDGLGGWFIDGVSGDPSSVIGIGLPLIRRLLEPAGLSISDLWAANPLHLADTTEPAELSEQADRDGPHADTRG